ncbi:retroviral-like aspartic protease family protein [Roseateles amylovorans]|uniref:Retroviral-like aspartic protease family protein n=1 Tax=Roseateles amylovorans TaxID=2978473 RepID=A0ABY6B0J4_9BURK|nr:retroviral-like aspartic protease family protein [Roseateles amylovorans]UXH78360.1 retroviral-like aspartic protease family protein [Roseateles amylovorans]
MPVLTFSKSQLGPIVDVLIAPGREAAQRLPATGGTAPPLPQPIKMLVDTGAETSALDEALIEPWGIPYVRAGWARTMNGTKPVRMYELALSIRGQAGQPSWNVDSLVVTARQEPFVGAPYAGLIGRDLLDRAVFLFNGPGHQCTLAF